jgi:hypothetical protein
MLEGLTWASPNSRAARERTTHAPGERNPIGGGRQAAPRSRLRPCKHRRLRYLERTPLLEVAGPSPQAHAAACKQTTTLPRDAPSEQEGLTKPPKRFGATQALLVHPPARDPHRKQNSEHPAVPGSKTCKHDI